MIKKYFGQFGEISKIMLPSLKKSFKGHCFIWYESEDSLQKVLQIKEHAIGERKLVCWKGKLRDWQSVIQNQGLLQQQAVDNGKSAKIEEKKEEKSQYEDMKITLLNEQIQEYEEMLDNYACPISFVLMVDPVTAEDGQTYERYYIEDWFAKNNTSPLTREELQSKKLIPNIKVKQAIAELNEKIKKCNTKIAELKIKKLKI